MCSIESDLAVLSCWVFSILNFYRTVKQDRCVGVSEALNLQLQGDMRPQSQESWAPHAEAPLLHTINQIIIWRCRWLQSNASMPHLQVGEGTQSTFPFFSSPPSPTTFMHTQGLKAKEDWALPGASTSSLSLTCYLSSPLCHFSSFSFLFNHPSLPFVSL